MSNKYELVKSFNLWLTGLPSSGKSTTAEAVNKALEEAGIKSVILDGDIIRTGLNSDLGFSKADREENNRRIIYVTKLFVDQGIPVLTAFISPYKKVRDLAKEKIENLILVYINTPLEKCMERDVKGLYAQAKAGKIKKMTGLDSEYEEPIDPDIEIHTVDKTIEENRDQIVEYLLERGFIRHSQ